MIDDYVGGYSPIEQENIELEIQVDRLTEELEQLKQQVSFLEQEKCELLGLLQKKDELIQKMQYSGYPRFDKCSTCERFLKQKFPDIDTSKFNIDENGNVIRNEIKKNFDEFQTKIARVASMEKYTIEEIKNRLSNIGEAIGVIALEYIEKLENENEQIKAQNKKMKRCEICKHRKDKNTKCLKTKLKKQKLICSAWELEE